MSDTATHADIPEVTLGWRLRIAMERAEIKADDMAKLLGVHRGTITRWTHDIGSTPRPIYLEKWASLCRVPLAWLTGELYQDPTNRLEVGGRTSDSSQGAGRDTHRCAAFDRELAAA